MTLTRAQRALLDLLLAEGAGSSWIECDFSEWRSAVALEKKGLLKIDEQAKTSEKPPRFFEVQLLPASRELRKGPIEIPYGEHIFVLVRPVKQDWSEFDGTTMKSGSEEWRPAMIRGHDQGQRVYVIGSQYAYRLDVFKIKPLDIAAQQEA